MFTRLKQAAARMRRTFEPLTSIATSNRTPPWLAEVNIRRAMSPVEAERSARVQLGGATQIHEAHRDARGVPLLDILCLHACASVFPVPRARDENSRKPFAAAS
jgi:hypothetical protein